MLSDCEDGGNEGTPREPAFRGRSAYLSRGETADPKPKLSDEQAQVAKDLIEGGKSVSAVSRNFKVSRPTIYRALERIDADV